MKHSLPVVSPLSRWILSIIMVINIQMLPFLLDFLFNNVMRFFIFVLWWELWDFLSLLIYVLGVNLRIVKFYSAQKV